uniref:Uncharacterized protein n=1 Tax=Panagrolaimus sp. ES5 TaxID=591445 RepID=A0AC34EYV6_9BILA
MESAAIISDKVDETLINELTGDNQVEQRIASNINHGVDATADKITEWRAGAHNLGQAAQDKLYGAAGAVHYAVANMGEEAGEWFQNAGSDMKNWVLKAGNRIEYAAASARDGVYNGLSATGQAIGNTVHGIKEGTNNMINGAENAIGDRLQQAGQAIKNN